MRRATWVSLESDRWSAIAAPPRHAEHERRAQVYPSRQSPLRSPPPAVRGSKDPTGPVLRFTTAGAVVRVHDRGEMRAV
jgi:Domain of unknown function (DUF397)